ncbi:MAG TPA: flagellar basal body rod protein FlgB [Solimonas sp.]|nr:flagellar basal body rod protein FlgB [Solimonas sp.]
MATDPLFGIHADALQLQRRRMELLAANIANADTPGYKARDLDFQKLLAAAQQPAATAAGVTQPGHMSLDDASLKSATVYRVSMQPSVDGNTVDAQVEQSQFAQSALQYQASLSFIDGRLRSLITAITGQ